MSDPIGGIPSHLLHETAARPTQGRNVVGKDDFMKLLMTQLQNQDPLKPMDAHDFSAQLAQFSQLEQLTNIGTGIKELRSGVGEEAKLQALGMMGRKITATGNSLSVVEGQSVSFQPMLGEGAVPTKAEIFDVSGKLVRELDLTMLAKGGEVEWDGKDTIGSKVPSGQYGFRVYGQKNGAVVTSGSELQGKVVGMDMSGLTPNLLVQTAAGQTRVELSKVRQVSMDTEPAKPAVAVQAGPATAPAAPKLELPKELVQLAQAEEAAPVEEAGESEPESEHFNFPNLYGPQGFGGRR